MLTYGQQFIEQTVLALKDGVYIIPVTKQGSQLDENNL